MIKIPKNKQKNYLNSIGLAAVFIIVLGVLWFFFWKPTPTYPLGNRLEYIGETRYGSIPFLSDSNPTASYNYATDLTPQEIVQYFKKATFKGDASSLDTQSSIIHLLFNTSQSQTFSIFYYSDGQDRMKKMQLKQISKSHVIIIESKEYQAAKNSI